MEIIIKIIDDGINKKIYGMKQSIDISDLAIDKRVALNYTINEMLDNIFEKIKE